MERLQILQHHNASICFTDDTHEYSGPESIRNVVIYLPRQNRVVNIDYRDINDWIKSNKVFSYNYQMKQSYQQLNEGVSFGVPKFSHYYHYSKVIDWLDIDSEVPDQIGDQQIVFPISWEQDYVIQVYLSVSDDPLYYRCGDLKLNTGDRVIVPYGFSNPRMIGRVLEEPELFSQEKLASFPFEIKRIVGKYIS